MEHIESSGSGKLNLNGGFNEVGDHDKVNYPLSRPLTASLLLHFPIRRSIVLQQVLFDCPTSTT